MRLWEEVYIQYRLVGSLFNLRRLNAKIRERLLFEALFADECAIMTHSESDIQAIVTRFALACRLFGLTIN